MSLPNPPAAPARPGLAVTAAGMGGPGNQRRVPLTHPVPKTAGAAADDMTLAARSQRAVWHPCTRLRPDAAANEPPLAIASGEGPWLVDADGRRYFDAISSWWVNLFGHANPAT